MRTNGIGALSALVAALFLAGCGGGSDGGHDVTANNANTPQANIQEVVSFGDSLNDVGTYNPTTAPGQPASGYTYAGLPFTTKPGTTWASYVALQYNFLLLPYERVDFGIPKSLSATGTGQVVQLGGTSFAQGGATVLTDAPSGGVVQLPIGPGGANVPVQEAIALSVKTQIDTYLAARGSFNAHQLILVDGGANDILNFLSGLSTNPGNAVNATAVVTAAATGMVTQLQRLVAAGATNIVYVNVPDIGVTPFATQLLAAANAQLPALATQMSTGYNQAVAAGIANTKIITFDTASMLKNVIAAPAQYGMVNVTTPACSTAAETTPGNITTLTSLICSQNTLVAAGADTNYLFADFVHPTNAAHKIWASMVMTQILPSIPK